MCDVRRDVLHCAPSICFKGVDSGKGFLLLNMHGMHVQVFSRVILFVCFARVFIPLLLFLMFLMHIRRKHPLAIYPWGCPALLHQSALSGYPFSADFKQNQSSDSVKPSVRRGFVVRLHQEHRLPVKSEVPSYSLSFVFSFVDSVNTHIVPHRQVPSWPTVRKFQLLCSPTL